VPGTPASDRKTVPGTCSSPYGASGDIRGLGVIDYSAEIAGRKATAQGRYF
jgi:hypothetical protein